MFLLSFLSKKDSQCQFLSEKKCREKKIHNSYIDITYIDTYAKLHINQEKIYITHIQMPPFIDGQSTLDSSGLRVLQCFLVEKTHLPNAKFFKTSSNNKKKTKNASRNPIPLVTATLAVETATLQMVDYLQPMTGNPCFFVVWMGQRMKQS